LEIAFTVWQSQPKNTMKQAAKVSRVDRSIHIILSDPLSNPIGSKLKTQVSMDL
jgi:hypothetical protein